MGASSVTSSSANASSSAVASAPVASSSRTLVPSGNDAISRPRTSPARAVSDLGGRNVASFTARAYRRARASAERNPRQQLPHGGERGRRRAGGSERNVDLAEDLGRVGVVGRELDRQHLFD